MKELSGVQFGWEDGTDLGSIVTNEGGDYVVNASDIQWNINRTSLKNAIDSTTDMPETIANSGDLIKAIAYASKNGGSEIKPGPHQIVVDFVDSNTVPSTLNSLNQRTVSTTSFAINDNSLTNATTITISRTTTAKYSLVAWPQSFGTFNIPEGYVPERYPTKLDDTDYWAIVSIEKSKSFVPLRVKR